VKTNQNLIIVLQRDESSVAEIICGILSVDL